MVLLRCPSGVAVAALALLAAGRGVCAGDGRQRSLASPLGPGPAHAAGGGPLTAEFGDFVRRTLDRWRVPGLSLAVIDGDDIFAEGYGLATLPDVKATPETLWYAGSTTKAQVAATLAQLIDSRQHARLAAGWSTPMASVIRDDFVLQDAWATSHVTLDDAVSHRSGMPRHDKSFARVLNGTQQTPRDIVRNMRNLPMNLEPRVAFQYCNLMYVTLGHLIETITAKGLGAVLRDVIWGPLGMNSTYLGLEAAQQAPGHHLATGYYWDKEAREYRVIPHMGLVEVSGAGGVISSVLDYARWIKCLLNGAAPFSKSVHSDIRKPRMLDTVAPGSGLDSSLYGLGWSRALYKGHVLYRHDGGVNAFGASIFWLPDAKFGAVAMGNTASTSNAAEQVIIYRLMEDKLGIPQGERFDMDKQWQDAMDKATAQLKDAEKILFPNIPDPPLPSTFETRHLVGTYSDPGYGEMTLRDEANPDRPDDRILVADRDNMTWRYQFRLHHVSGDYWIVYVTIPQNPSFFNEFHRGEFKQGVDGNVSVLEIEWLDEGKAVFQRVS